MTLLTATATEAPQFYGLLLGTSFMLLYASMFTVQNLLTSVLDADLAFYSLAVLYFSVAAGNLLSIEIVNRVSPRVGMVGAALGYTMWIGSTTLAAYHVVPNLVYVGSVIAGVSAAIIWGVSFRYLISLTTPDRAGVWQGMFFLCFSLNPIVGQGLALLLTDAAKLPGKKVFLAMTILSAVAALSFLLLRPRPSHLPPLAPVSRRPWRAVLQTLLPTLWQTIVRTRRLLPLFLAFGFCQPYFFGYLSARMRLQLTIQSLLLGGVGGVLSSIMLGKLSDMVRRRNIIVFTLATQIVGCLLSIAAVRMTHADHPTSTAALPHSVGTDALFRLAFICYGVSEGGFNTQCRSSITVLFPRHTDEGNSIFILFATSAMATGFLYGPHLPQGVQAGLVILLCLVAGVSCWGLPLNAPKGTADAPETPFHETDGDEVACDHEEDNDDDDNDDRENLLAS